MQLDWAKATNNGESKLRCEVHPEYELQILHFEKKSQRKQRMLCVQCLIESNNKRENLYQFVHLHNFLNDPKNTLMKIVNINNDQNQQNISQILDELDNLLLQFEEVIKTQVVKIKENIQQMRMQIQQIGEELSNELKLNDVVKQIQLLKQMDSCQGAKELTNLENQLNFISENLNKSYMNQYNKVQGNQRGTAKTLQDNLQIINNDIETILKKFMDNLPKLDLFEGVEDIIDFPLIHKQISEGKIIEYQLVYSSTRDGLGGKVYWGKCHSLKNLLTIMTSKNGNKFGGYSPCQMNQQLYTCVQDPSMKSFIFQYNKKEIYKLKNKEKAVLCNLNYGPIFGNSDILIDQDFQTGQSSDLGESYDISGYNIVDKATHIFGAKTPQVQECKVYQIIFK